MFPRRGGLHARMQLRWGSPSKRENAPSKFMSFSPFRAVAFSEAVYSLVPFQAALSNHASGILRSHRAVYNKKGTVRSFTAFLEFIALHDMIPCCFSFRANVLPLPINHAFLYPAGYCPVPMPATIAKCFCIVQLIVVRCPVMQNFCFNASSPPVEIE